MEIFQFVEKVFFIELTILSSFTNPSSLSCISIINQECKTRQQIVNATVTIPYFILLVLK